MAQRTYEGEPIDGTMKHISERDLDEEAEDVDVPQDDQYEGDVSTEYGFLDDDDLSKKEKVERLWRRSDYKYDERGSVRAFYEETVSPVLEISEAYMSTVVKEVEESKSDGGIDSVEEETEVDGEEPESASNSTDESGESRVEQVDREIYSREQIEHDVLKPLIFAQKFASGEELEALEEAEELVEVLLNKGDQ
jgi:hypothetical protein